MDFEWDDAKNDANIAKHGVSFEMAVGILDRPVLTLFNRVTEYGETRQMSIGRLGDIVMLAVIHTDRDGRVRLISARPASRRERKYYEQTLR